MYRLMMYNAMAAAKTISTVIHHNHISMLNIIIANTIKTPEAITAANFGMFFLCGSISLFKFNIIITYKNNTMMAPAYTIICTAAKNCAFNNK